MSLFGDDLKIKEVDEIKEVNELKTSKSNTSNDKSKSIDSNDKSKSIDDNLDLLEISDFQRSTAQREIALEKVNRFVKGTPLEKEWDKFSQNLNIESKDKNFKHEKFDDEVINNFLEEYRKTDDVAIIQSLAIYFKNVPSDERNIRFAEATEREIDKNIFYNDIKKVKEFLEKKTKTETPSIDPLQDRYRNLKDIVLINKDPGLDIYSKMNENEKEEFNIILKKTANKINMNQSPKEIDAYFEEKMKFVPEPVYSVALAIYFTGTNKRLASAYENIADEKLSEARERGVVPEENLKRLSNKAEYERILKTPVATEDDLNSYINNYAERERLKEIKADADSIEERSQPWGKDEIKKVDNLAKEVEALEKKSQSSGADEIEEINTDDFWTETKDVDKEISEADDILEISDFERSVAEREIALDKVKKFVKGSSLEKEWDNFFENFKIESKDKDFNSDKFDNEILSNFLGEYKKTDDVSIVQSLVIYFKNTAVSDERNRNVAIACEKEIDRNIFNKNIKKAESSPTYSEKYLKILNEPVATEDDLNSYINDYSERERLKEIKADADSIEEINTDDFWIETKDVDNEIKTDADSIEERSQPWGKDEIKKANNLAREVEEDAASIKEINMDDFWTENNVDNEKYLKMLNELTAIEDDLNKYVNEQLSPENNVDDELDLSSLF